MRMSSRSLLKLAGTALIAVMLGVSMNFGVSSDADDSQHAHSSNNTLHMTHIATLAEVEALKPGDSIAMACSMCKNIMVQRVGQGHAHLKMMTIGHTHTCGVCKGTVAVVGTGKGQGKRQQVKHVCSKCGDDTMFVCATRVGHAHQHADHD